MLSRVANSIYWMSRYVERAENVARFLDVNFSITLGAGEPLQAQWAPLVYTTGDEAKFLELYDTPSRDNVLRFLTIDRKNPNSIVSCVESARENARSVRDNIPVGVWQQLNKFYLMIKSVADLENLEEPGSFCEQVRLSSHLINGMTDATMSRGEGWHFTQLGRLLERADKTSRIVDVQYYLLLPDPSDIGSNLDVIRWSALLQSATALTMYRRLYGRIAPSSVANFLLLNQQFPRSVHFCLIHAQNSLKAIAGTPVGSFRYNSEQELGRLRAELEYTRIEDVIEQGLHEFIDNFQTRLNKFGAAIHHDFFTLPEQTVGATQTQRQTSSTDEQAESISTK